MHSLAILQIIHVSRRGSSTHRHKRIIDVQRTCVYIYVGDEVLLIKVVGKRRRIKTKKKRRTGGDGGDDSHLLVVIRRIDFK